MKILKYLVHEKLSHLTEIRIDELLDRYYENEKIAILLQKFDIQVPVSRFHTFLPFKIQHDCKCKYCNISMATACPNRNKRPWREFTSCPKCDHGFRPHINFYRCECVNCLGEKERELAKINEIKIAFIISENASTKKTPANIQELSLKNRLYLSAILHACLVESMDSIAPLKTAMHVLAPTKMYCEYIVQHLYERKFIVPSLINELDAFDIKENRLVIIDIQSIGWELNLKYDGKSNLVGLINYLKDLENINNINDEDICEAWIEIATYECIEFLAAKLEEIRFPKNIGQKTQQIIANTLDNFSTSQVFQFIWMAVNRVPAFQRLKNTSYTHAVNTIPGNIETYSKRVLANNWSVKGYERDYDLEQSMLSKIFYNSLLKIGDKGFKIISRKQLIKTLSDCQV